MKKYIFIFASCLFMCSCMPRQEEMNKREREKHIQDSIANVEVNKKNAEKIAKLANENKTPSYWIKIRSNTYKYTRTIIWINVTEDFFDKYMIGDNIEPNKGEYGNSAEVIYKEVR